MVRHEQQFLSGILQFVPLTRFLAASVLKCQRASVTTLQQAGDICDRVISDLDQICRNDGVLLHPCTLPPCGGFIRVSHHSNRVYSAGARCAK
jgi:hypothetical protein